MASIHPATCSATTGLPPTTSCDVPADGAPTADAAPAGLEGGAGQRDPWAEMALHDLHPAVQSLTRSTDAAEPFSFGPDIAHADARHPAGAGTPLYNAPQVPGGTRAQAPAVAAPPPVPAPIDLRRMEAMNTTVQNFNVRASVLPEADLRATQRSFKAATEALRRGDYKAAEQELKKLGFPLPAPGGRGQPSQQAVITAHMLGATTHGTRERWSVDLTWGARGNQAVNDLDGFAANARMVNRVSWLSGGVANPPTEAQAMRYMKAYGRPMFIQPPHPHRIMQAASEITNGSIVHYSAAGASDPRYGANPQPHAFYRDRQGQVHEFDSLADARAAARAGDPPMRRGTQITVMDARSPDAWSDITSQGSRAGRHIGDCESKLYLQTRLLTQAGFKSLGSVDVQPRSGSIGHMLGVFQARDGSVWVTSNEDYRRVPGSGPKGAVTQADVDAVLRDMTADVYHIQPDIHGVRDTSHLIFSAAATRNLSGPDAAVASLRRATELGLMGMSDALIPPPAP
ncbi:hypothetical protein [Piscinibacter sp. XHJ-5]|uniref:hypothetical protein n=1 Tax=Piscinibacter sp. XHJ-5 TaxID=3037797 RepID=UPI002452A44A|nr:hypothetical protein [Piscinibacter sp. XHJ-5]